MTYSVVARDQRTGELGVACQSHFFGVGSAVNWAEAGVGVVATQSLVKPAYGWRGLELMREGVPAPEALKIILTEDPHPERRQVAMLDADGKLAVHTGEQCIGVRGSRDGGWFAVQGNMLTAERVLDAMAAAMADGDGPLAERLVAALRAAEAAGGESRGSQAAGIRVVTGAAAELPWADTLLDVRVEDATDPVTELARLVRQQQLAGPVVEVLFTEGLIRSTPRPSCGARWRPDCPARPSRSTTAGTAVPRPGRATCRRTTRTTHWPSSSTWTGPGCT
jgi:uncharacterized Ntn-hydrolase superfamily protein